MAEPMKIRAKMDGDVADIKVLMNHLMETGLRKDAKTGQLVPAHYITDVTATVNGATVLDAGQLGRHLQEPLPGLQGQGAKTGDKVVISWVDNKGDKNTAEATIS